MRRWIRLAAALYPSGWRNRYGLEFAALLEDVRPGWRDFWDVLRGAMEMQIRARNIGKVAAVCGLSGALIASVVAFRMENQYLSSAVLRVRTSDAAKADKAAEQIDWLTVGVLSRSSLTEIIVKEDLYKAARQRLPLEEIVANMKNRDIRIAAVRGSLGKPTAFLIQFRYPDANAAQRANRDLITGMVEANLLSGPGGSRIAAPVEILDPASLPQRPLSPNRLLITVFGLIGGLLLGSVFGLFKFRVSTR